MAGIDFDYDTAIAKCKPNSLETGIAQVLKSAYCNDVKQSNECLDKAIECFSTTTSADRKIWRAYAYYRQGNYERALADIAAAANKTESHSELQGLIYSKLKQQEQTLSAYQKAIDKNSQKDFFSPL
jgi:tetratricopeptide (TPR) repeat protein